MNNIIKFEFKNTYKSLFTWIISFVLVSFIFASMFPAFSKDLQALIDIFNNFPDSMTVALGLDISVWDSFEGYFTYELIFLAIISFSFSSVSALKMFNKEYRNKSIEFLFTKPSTRIAIFNSKVIVLLLLNIIFFVITFLASFIFGKLFGELNFISFLELNLILLNIQIFAMLFSTLFAIIFTRLKGIGSVGFMTAFGFYFIYIIGNLVEEKIVSYISIYGLYVPIDIVKEGYLVLPVIIAVIINLILYTCGLVVYKKKDVL